MAKFIIEGGRPLNGTVTPSGNKNEALPALMCCLLSEETVILENVPQIGDVLTVCKILRGLGVEVEWQGDRCLHLNAKHLSSYKPDRDLCTRVRASILLLGPLLSRLGKIELPLPGGDVIGARRIDTHWEGAVALGATLQLQQGILGEAKSLIGTDLFLDEPSVTATENLLLLSVRAQGTTVIHNAAAEPHVVGLSNLLNSMGANISGIGSNRLVIQGVECLHGTRHRIGSDFMEVASFICLGGATEGALTIKDVDPEQYRFIFKTLRRLGLHPEIREGSFHIADNHPGEMQRDISGRVGTIYSGPWPAFPTDLMSVAIVAATQAKGMIIFFEKMFEGRMFFTDKLMAMGAGIVLCDPHRIVVTGPSQLYPAQMSSPDVRAGMALLMAGLVANGKSEINNIYQIERGYHQIDKKLESLGAAITRVS